MLILSKLASGAHNLFSHTVCGLSPKPSVCVALFAKHGAGSRKASSISLWHSSRYKTLILTICALLYLSVPSRGSCDPAEWTASHSRWRGVTPSTQRGRSCLCASWVCTFVARLRRLDAAEIGDQALTGRTSLL